MATIIHIPNDYPSIGQGIEAANNGDTVLVEPGTYKENINYEGKNIVVGSLFVTTGDAAHISNTTIDGDSIGSVVIFNSGEDTSAALIGFTITNGLGGGSYPEYLGGGITCNNNSNPSLKNLRISRNFSDWYGGGLFCGNSTPSLEDVTISENITKYNGGGIFFMMSSPILKNVTVSYNRIREGGGQGGGICFENSYPIFDSEKRCNIYYNEAHFGGSDLFVAGYEWGRTISVVLDTFTVLTPTDYYAYPISVFTFDILHPKGLQSDLYVSPDGDDVNSGDSAEEPLRTISTAFMKIYADSLNPRTIHLANGVYSPSTNGDQFPLDMVNYVSLAGESELSVILNAENQGRVMDFDQSRGITVENLTITGGIADKGGGISCYRSNPTFKNVTISGNIAEEEGGGLYCKESSPKLVNVTIKDNESDNGGGVYCGWNSSPIFSKVTIKHNAGSGLFLETSSNPTFDTDNRCNIYNNYTTGDGNDITASYPWPIDATPRFTVVVDTFTVMKPTNTQVYPRALFNFDILHAFLEQVENDLYVSPEGDDANSGQSPEEPKRTITAALVDISVDSLNPRTIHLADGVYSPSTNGEQYPLNMVSNISLAGESEFGVVLNAENQGSVLKFTWDLGITIEKLTITGGKGGVYCSSYSNPVMKDVTISGNTADYSGGGLYFHQSNPRLENVTITENAAGSGGGIYSDYNSRPSFSGVTVSFNTTTGNGGGIYFYKSYPTFDSDNRCNIYSNNALSGSDLYAELYRSDSIIPVVVDTFTVLYPTNYHAYPRNLFSFDILHAYLEQVEDDLYVDPEGDDTNSGLSPEEPLHTIITALGRIESDSLNPHTIHLADGVYSPSTNGEQYPLFMVNYVSLAGESEHGVILDAEEQLRVLEFNQNRGITVSSLTVTGGKASGIFCSESSPNLNNITIRDNKHYYNGGGISLSQSSPIMMNVTIRDNQAYEIGGGGIDCGNNSNPTMENVAIIHNRTLGSDFSTGNGAGIRCWGSSSPTLRNVTISGNTTLGQGSGIFLDESDLSIINTIIWNASPHDQPQEIYFSPSHGRSSITVSSSDIQGGRGSILTNNNGSVDWQDSNTSEDPLFCNPDSGDYTLAENSPCAGSGENGANMGAFEVSCDASLVGQVESDLYVTPEGADTNSGKTSSEPLKTISFALAIIKADSLHPHTIYLDNGTYSPSTNGEQFPLYLVDHVSLSGESESGVILDAEKTSGVLIIDGKKGVTIENITISGGASRGENGGGISCYDSNPTFMNLTISQNKAGHYFREYAPYGGEGGGISCNRSSPRIVNVRVYGNEASLNGGGISCFQSNPILENVEVSGNSTIGWDVFYGHGGGIYCNQSNPSLENVVIYNNTTLYQGGGIHCSKSSPSLKNVTVTNNTAIDTSWYGGGGGISVAYNSSPNLLYTILWNNTSEIHFNEWGDPSRITISYSDVEGGRTQIVTNDNGTVDWLDGNISLDPLFCDPDSGDYTLADNSPCRGKGKNAENIGALDVGCKFIPGPDYPDSPLSIELYQNFPNPFNLYTTLWYALPENTHVTLTIYNIRGQLINTVVERPVDEGYNSIIWDGTDDYGRAVGAGIYIYQIIAGDFIQTRKMVLLK